MNDDVSNGPVRDDRRREEPAGPVLLAELSTIRLRDMASEIELVLVPVGAHEQHGPALPAMTDTLTAQVLSALVGTMLRPRVAVAPVIPWGVSWTHLGFAGTVSLREETLIGIVEDVVTSLHRSGFERFLLVNTHGGNVPSLQIAAERCHRERGVPVVASVYAYELMRRAAERILGSAAIGHGGGDETSAVLAVRPDLVDPGALGPRRANGAIRDVAAVLRASSGSLPVAQKSISDSGASGDSTSATADAGNAILGEAAAGLQAIAEQLLGLDISAMAPA